MYGVQQLTLNMNGAETAVAAAAAADRSASDASKIAWKFWYWLFWNALLPPFECQCQSAWISPRPPSNGRTAERPSGNHTRASTFAHCSSTGKKLHADDYPAVLDTFRSLLSASESNRFETEMAAHARSHVSRTRFGGFGT